MRMSGFKGGIGGESKHVAHSGGRVEDVRSDGSLHQKLDERLRQKN